MRVKHLCWQFSPGDGLMCPPPPRPIILQSAGVTRGELECDVCLPSPWIGCIHESRVNVSYGLCCMCAVPLGWIFWAEFHPNKRGTRKRKETKWWLSKAVVETFHIDASLYVSFVESQLGSVFFLRVIWYHVPLPGYSFVSIASIARYVACIVSMSMCTRYTAVTPL